MARRAPLKLVSSRPSRRRANPSGKLPDALPPLPPSDLVARQRALVERQRILIARARECGVPTAAARDTLASLWSLIPLLTRG